MKKMACNFLWGVMLIASACSIALAQEGAGAPAKPKETFDPKITTRVTLGSSSGTPGTLIVIPIYFTPAEGVNVGQLKLEVNFVSANLKFDKLERGIAAEMGNVDVKSSLKTAKNDKDLEVSTVTVEAGFPSSETPKKGIPSGLLGYLTMRIADTGRPANITLRASAEGTELGSNKPVQNLRAIDAQVEVLAPGTMPLITCFFFTH
jgi:hypothetical protein